jgi:hypothetical protein
MRHLLLLIAATVALGCERSGSPQYRSDLKSAAPTVAIPGIPAFQREPPPAGGEPARVDREGRDGIPAHVEPAQPAPVQRRVIQNATLELLVEDFEAARQALLGLVEEHQGFVAGSEVGGSPGAPRSGHWIVRVPVAKFAPFVEAAVRLGESVRNRTDAQDVTDQFVDLEARLKNKRTEEERLLDHLKKSTGKLEDILAVERELSRVRGEIEQTQGRLQKLTDLTALSTVTITLSERRGYVPPQAPSFGTTVGRTFSDSVGLLVDFGKWLALFVVALAPWLPVLAVVGTVVWIVMRRRRTFPVQPAVVQTEGE